MPSELLSRTIYFLRIGMTAWASVSLAAFQSQRPAVDISKARAAFDSGDYVLAADILETEVLPFAA